MSSKKPTPPPPNDGKPRDPRTISPPPPRMRAALSFIPGKSPETIQRERIESMIRRLPPSVLDTVEALVVGFLPEAA